MLGDLIVLVMIISFSSILQILGPIFSRLALVVISGQPCSGKSMAALCLDEALKESESKVTVRIIDETFFHLDRNQSYANMTAAKNLCGVLRCEVDRSVSKDNIIIVDSLNSIKGYRYELWCLARATGIRYCVLYCDVEDTHCRKWNEERQEKGEAAYDDNIFEDLARRFEKPDRRNRWDSSLFKLWPYDNGKEKSSDAILDAVSYLTKKMDSKSRDFGDLTAYNCYSEHPIFRSKFSLRIGQGDTRSDQCHCGSSIQGTWRTARVAKIA